MYPYLREGVCFTFWLGGGSLFEAMRFYSNNFLFFPYLPDDTRSRWAKMKAFGGNLQRGTRRKSSVFGV